MKIAVVCENNKISQHFGRAEGFYVYDSSKKEYHESNGHGTIPNQLKELGVEFVACGGIGEGALNNLKSLDIKVFSGLEGFCDDIADGFFKQILVTGNAGCNSHDHHHGHGHSCNCKCGK
ncbi:MULTISPECIES: NifB/NifX family molybdenum-iron cluster-binding protein [Cetobacterium]|jgi:predicted Fe-Mo cluster-binding NifX family protein|uniref:NifB/NifX family molybdenum-iron cluster-binding protein n=1 Tax=Candidatus Cetobacterium colombiensis TaxID=3073100 RepID=A0ABU4WB44_9FUSO|nr:NifB/NifX family molybdenum-iron cluster-binding protein [Candidatus Cetobacterium colombiensis]MDX8336763.1 NifB/NifX family molybdenum-iron cluster-binding protein [Candidatus Cetobacterium colombiensis]